MIYRLGTYTTYKIYTKYIYRQNKKKTDGLNELGWNPTEIYEYHYIFNKMTNYNSTILYNFNPLLSSSCISKGEKWATKTAKYHRHGFQTSLKYPPTPTFKFSTISTYYLFVLFWDMNAYLHQQCILTIVFIFQILKLVYIFSFNWNI